MYKVLEQFSVLSICLEGEERVGLTSTLVTLLAHTTFFKKKKKQQSTYQTRQVPTSNRGAAPASRHVKEPK